MKRVNINILMIAALVAVSAMVVSCEDLFHDPPTIKVNLNGTNQYSIEVDVAQSVTMQVTWEATGGLDEIGLSRVPGSSEQGYPMKSGFESKTFHRSGNITVNSPSADGGTVTFSATLKAKKGDILDKNELITITFKKAGVDPPPPQGKPIHTWDNKSLGSFGPAGWGGSAGSSFVTSNGTIYTQNDARTNSASVDFIYYNDMGSHTISSPKSTPNDINSTLVNWGTRRGTKLQRLTSVTTSQFDSMTDDQLIVANVTSITSESVTSIATGHIIGFITDGGKRGMIKINSVGSPANHINITVKVQQ